MKKYLIINTEHAPRIRSDERGMALLLTLLVTIILAVVVLEFNYLMRVHATLSGNLVDDLRAQAAARAGVEKAKAMLLNDMSADLKQGISLDTLDEEWASEAEPEEGSSSARLVITDEMSKLNLNRLVNRSSAESDIESVNRPMVENVRHLFELLEIDPNLVDCMVDWIDENDQEEPFGEESAYYESLDPPINCKNGPMDSIEELLLVKGFDAKMLYGDEDVPGLAEYVTVFGDEQGLVNINTADEKVIAAVLNSESLASMIVDMRENSPFAGAAEMAARLPDVNVTGKFTTGSSCFMVSSTGSSAPGAETGREVKIKALLKRIKPDVRQLDTQYLGVETAYWKVER